MPYFENQGARLYYEESGQGKPLIFLHGFGLDLRQWKQQVQRFSGQYKTIALDARGHGKSTLPPGRVAPTVFWQDVVALMDHLQIATASICGLSMGGHVALQVGIYAGHRVENLILIGAICTNKFNWYERLLVPVNRFCTWLMPISWVAWCVSVGMGNFSPKARPYLREAVGSISHSAYNRAWKAVTSMESKAGLVKIGCPTLLLIGDHDSMTGRQQQYMHRHISGSCLATIKNAHHATNLDNPAQVEHEIEKFLNRPNAHI